MEILILLRQVLTMFLLSGVGFVLVRTGKITLEGGKTIGNILIYLSLPCVILNSFTVDFTRERLIGLGLSALAAAVLLGVSILVSALVFRKDPVSSFASAFSNPGFFGVPVIAAVLGEDAVFYIAPFIALVNMLQWTYGVSRLTGQSARQGLSLKRIFTAPFMVAILLGLVLFFTGFRLPGVLATGVKAIAGLNTPLAMFSIGLYLSQCHFKELFLTRRLYLVSFLRLLMIPLLSLALLTLLPRSFFPLKLAVLIAAACPVGSNVAVYAQLYGKNYSYAVETVVISTLLSILTLPLLTAAAQLLWA